MEAPTLTRIVGVVPYAGGYLGLVIGERTPARANVIAHHSMAVGRLVEVPDAEASRIDKRRECTDDDLAELAVAIGQMLTEGKAQRVVIEASSQRAEIAPRIVSMLVAECEALGLPHELRFSTWRLGLGQGKVRRTRAREIIGEVFDAVPFAYDSTLFAAALIVTDLESLTSVAKTDSDVHELSTGASPAMANLLAEVHARKVARGDAPLTVASTAAVPRERKPAFDTDSDISLGKVSAAIDPGCYYLGLSIAEGDTWPLTLRHLDTIAVGHEVELKKPKKLTSGAVLTTQHVIDDADLKTVVDECIRRLIAHGVTRLFMEHVEYVHLPSDNQALCVSIATNLVRSMWIGATIAERARANGITVTRCPTATWRARVVGRLGKKGGDGADRITTEVPSHFTNWPHSANDHEFDAGGLNLWGCAPVEVLVEKKAKNRKSEKEPKEKKKRRCTRDIERKQAREEAGCKCPPRGRHFGSCPLSKARKDVAA